MYMSEAGLTRDEQSNKTNHEIKGTRKTNARKQAILSRNNGEPGNIRCCVGQEWYLRDKTIR